MNGRKVLLDSNIIIFASKQILNLNRLFSDYDEFYVSIITYMEVYGYNFGNEAEKLVIDTLFENIEIVDINMAIALNVIQYRQLPHKKIKIPDAIILSSAKTIGADLLTGDWDDFNTIDNSVTIVKYELYQ
jgi:predicted nucleic acid-binding protein